jgi:hypothetical protein
MLETALTLTINRVWVKTHLNYDEEKLRVST